MVEAFTRPFFDELASRINSDPDFQKKSGSLNLKILMSCRDKNRHFLMTITNGKVAISDAAADTPADFAFSGDYEKWQINHKGDQSLEQMIMSGKIKFKGSMAKILGVRSQLTMVDKISQKVPAEF